MRVVGVDPGTKSFDVIAIENGKAVQEGSVETSALVHDPMLLLREIERARPTHVIAPSGYGVPLTRGSEVRDVRRFALEILLLSTEDQIRAGERAGLLGVNVYRGLALVTEQLVGKMGERVLFLPAVIHLPTVPRYRKLNKMDMGTVDKLAATFAATHFVARRESVDYDKVDLVTLELGYGYVGSIAVEGGKVVDGIGGSYASVGLVTAGALDLEVVGAAGSWTRWDVWSGGLYELSPQKDMAFIAKEAAQGDRRAEELLHAYVEGAAKDVARALLSTPRSRLVVASGRFSRSAEIVSMLREKLRELEVIPLSSLLPGNVKEAAFGYAAMGEGVLGGVFAELSAHMRIAEACGTAADYIVHPRALGVKEAVQKAYAESVTRPRFCS
ncbi:MAG: DUF1464 family protein [Acidilobaceae archaeon]|nr:DUF1464 family protein [Acidilobaceae archaeon]MDW7973781.1 DUF1464 family protein [Sulfolobales archaeon]